MLIFPGLAGEVISAVVGGHPAQVGRFVTLVSRQMTGRSGSRPLSLVERIVSLLIYSPRV